MITYGGHAVGSLFGAEGELGETQLGCGVLDPLARDAVHLEPVLEHGRLFRDLSERSVKGVKDVDGWRGEISWRAIFVRFHDGQPSGETIETFWI